MAPSLLAFLARTSFTFVVEELGVTALELFGDFESPPATVDEVESGDAVAELESFFFEDLFESFALDNCSCWKSVNSQALTQWVKDRHVGQQDIKAERSFTYHSLPEAFHLVRTTFTLSPPGTGGLPRQVLGVVLVGVNVKVLM